MVKNKLKNQQIFTTHKISLQMTNKFKILQQQLNIDNNRRVVSRSASLKVNSILQLQQQEDGILKDLHKQAETNFHIHLQTTNKFKIFTKCS